MMLGAMDKKGRGARKNAPYPVPNGPQPLLAGALHCSVGSGGKAISSTRNVAAGPGLEPGQTDPKSVVLPITQPGRAAPTPGIIAWRSLTGNREVAPIATVPYY